MTKRCPFFFAGIAFSPNHSTKHWFYALATGVGEGWTSLPILDLLTRALCRKHWKRISAESPLMSPRRPNWSRDWNELKYPTERTKDQRETSRIEKTRLQHRFSRVIIESRTEATDPVWTEYCLSHWPHGTRDWSQFHRVSLQFSAVRPFLDQLGRRGDIIERRFNRDLPVVSSGCHRKQFCMDRGSPFDVVHQAFQVVAHSPRCPDEWFQRGRRDELQSTDYMELPT